MIPSIRSSCRRSDPTGAQNGARGFRGVSGLWWLSRVWNDASRACAREVSGSLNWWVLELARLLSPRVPRVRR